MDKKLDSNYTRMLLAILNKSWSSSCTATYHPSWKLSKLDKPDMRDTAGEVEMISKVMYSCGPLHIDEQKQNDQPEPTYSSSVPIRDVALKICRKQWTIGRGREKGSGISLLIARHDDDDDDDAYQKLKLSNVVEGYLKVAFSIINSARWMGETILFSLDIVILDLIRT